MACARRAQGRVEAHGVPHFADHDDVGILPQHVPQPIGECACVEADFALLDDRLLVAKQKLDRILERDDVAARRRVDVPDHRRERRRFPRAGRARHQHDAAWRAGELAQLVRQAELREIRNLAFHQSHRERPLAALAIGIDPEARPLRRCP